MLSKGIVSPISSRVTEARLEAKGSQPYILARLGHLLPLRCGPKSTSDAHGEMRKQRDREPYILARPKTRQTPIGEIPKRRDREPYILARY